MPYVLASRGQPSEPTRVPFPPQYPITPSNSSATVSPIDSGPPSPVDEVERISRPRKKSSLKHGQQYRTPSPSSRNSPMRRTRSMSHGMPKLVHFPSQDAELQSVRTFNMSARPVAISNPGSDGDDSEEEGYEEEQLHAADTTIYRIDLSRSVLPDASTQPGNVKLDALEFGNDAVLRGRVRVRNISYDKRVVARFSLDAWESTSEVVATYYSSTPCHQWDNFTFTIRLEDMNLRDRVLSLCVNYAAGGETYWDNNNHHNYSCTFAPIQANFSPPPITTWDTPAPRRRSATVGGEYTPATPHIHHKKPGGGWHDWSRNTAYRPQAQGASGPRANRPIFVI